MQRRLVTWTSPFLRYSTQTPPPASVFPTSSTRSTLSSPLPQPLLSRSFQTTHTTLAQEVPSSPFGAEYSREGVEGGELFNRLQNHPEALKAIEDLTRLAKEKTGVDLSGGDKPSMSMMIKLARDPELRQCAERLMNALRSAGINIDPRAAFEALKVMGGDGLAGLNAEDALGDLMKSGKGNKGDGEGEKK